MGLGKSVSWNALITFVVTVGSRFSKFLGSVVFANVAGGASLGVFYLFTSLFRVLRKLIGLGLGQAIVTQTAEAVSSDDTDHVGEIVSSALLVRLTSLCFVSVVLYAARHRLGRYVGLNRIWIYLVVALSLTMLLSTARSVLVGVKRVDVASTLDFLKEISMIVIQIALVLLGFDAFGLVAGFLAGMAVPTALAIVRTARFLEDLHPARDRIEAQLSFARFSFLDSLVGGEQIWIDTLMLGAVVTITQSDIGVYGITYSIAMFGLTLSSSISRAILPEIRDLDVADQYQNRDRLVQKSIKYSTLIALPLFFGALAIGDNVLAFIYGFDRGFEPLLFLTAGTMVFSIYQPVHQTFYALDRPRTAFLVSAVTSLSNFSLNILLIPPFGIAGAGLSTAASMCLSAATGLLLLRRLGVVSPLPFRAWRIQFGAAVLMALIVRFGDVQVGTDSLLSTSMLVTAGVAIYASVVLVGDSEIRKQLFNRLGSLTAP
ncbi:lipid II flippase MurJ [Haloarcula brevis]|uniref:lipid II flippase MurJ n=1 Tax=Haloarcula brevis TaxID=3111453 RepID=UPI00300F704B